MLRDERVNTDSQQVANLRKLGIKKELLVNSVSLLTLKDAKDELHSRKAAFVVPLTVSRHFLFLL